jgi:hypothetical protein
LSDDKRAHYTNVPAPKYMNLKTRYCCPACDTEWEAEKAENNQPKLQMQEQCPCGAVGIAIKPTTVYLFLREHEDEIRID